MMVGLDAPTSGQIRIDGRRYADLRFPLRHVGALLEAKAIHPSRSMAVFRVTPDAVSLPPWTGFAVLLGWAAVSLIAGGVLLARRDA